MQTQAGPEIDACKDTWVVWSEFTWWIWHFSCVFFRVFMVRCAHKMHHYSPAPQTVCFPRLPAHAESVFLLYTCFLLHSVSFVVSLPSIYVNMFVVSLWHSRSFSVLIFMSRINHLTTAKLHSYPHTKHK